MYLYLHVCKDVIDTKVPETYINCGLFCITLFIDACDVRIFMQFRYTQRTKMHDSALRSFLLKKEINKISLQNTENVFKFASTIFGGNFVFN